VTQVIVLGIAFINIFMLFTGINALSRHLVPMLPKVLRIFSSALISLAMVSFLYFLMLVLNQGLMFILILLSCINLFHLHWTHPELKSLFNYKTPIIDQSEILVPLVAVLLMAIFLIFRGSKYGDYDAWAIWNVHAKYLYYPHIWTHVFNDSTAMSHSDYPLMLPSLVAFFWGTINNTSFVIPLLLSFIILITIAILLYFALIEAFQSKIYGCFALFLLIADHNFQSLNTAQCADSWLSLFILLTFVLNNQLKRINSSNLAYFLAFICASCTWIKNEGDLFYLVFTTVFIISNYKRGPVITKYLIGSILPLIVTICFKVFFAPANDLVAASDNQMSRQIGDLKDVSRYNIIFKTYATTLLDRFLPAVILVLSLLLVNRNFFKSFAFIVIFILFSGFTLIYLTTPYDLGWHLYTSLWRLLYQIYPSLLYISIIAYGNVLSKKPNIDPKEAFGK